LIIHKKKSYYNINSVANLGTRCSYCGGKKLCDNNECTECFEKLFASHEKSKYWSKKIIKIQDINLRVEID